MKTHPRAGGATLIELSADELRAIILALQYWRYRDHGDSPLGDGELETLVSDLSQEVEGLA